MATREEAHRLLDAVPAERLDSAVASLQSWAETPAVGELFDGEPVRRQLRTIGIFDGEADLGARTREVLRRELGGQGDHDSKTA